MAGMNRRGLGRHTLVLGLLAAIGFGLPGTGAEPEPARRSISLNGSWLFQTNSAPTNQWQTVSVPSAFQSYVGTNFHGVGWYRKSIQPFSVPPGKLVLVHFQAAATEAEVWWNGQRLGTHLGGWTPFRFDVTDLVRQAPPGKPHELRVRLDEKVGYNTQGFLPIIAPHFGGLWQDVSLVIVPETYIDDLRLLAVGTPTNRELHLEVPLAGTQADRIEKFAMRGRRLGEQTWTNLPCSFSRSSNLLFAAASMPEARLWSPAEPNLYELELILPGPGADQYRTCAAFRSIEAVGQQLRLNGQPLSVRGLLNWGYSPPLLAPNPGETAWRSELEFARSHGFNLMKFCLWVPPQRYFELADELGILTWVEYPTWHPDLTEKHLEPLRREFEEFFAYDRNHPSVILRSLTCETGPSAELKVIRSLYDSAHKMIPGALVEDDSSWISWNRISDFYDDHPYGNNETWVKTLDGFNEYIQAHGMKPLVLGETTAADTWLDRDAALERLGNERPWWAPGVLDDSGRWLERMRRQSGPAGLAELGRDSLRYGLLMRKFQIEAFRRVVPNGGYVISVIRDIPKASMGLLDYLGRSKWPAADWDWQRDTMCLLQTASDRRSFTSGEPLRGQILLSHFGPGAISGQLEATLESFGQPGKTLQRNSVTNVQQGAGALAQIADLDWPTPDVSVPTHLVIRTSLKTAMGEFRNEWPIWVLPANPDPQKVNDVEIHRSVPASLAHDLFPASPSFDGKNQRAIVVASHFDDDLVGWLENGGKVLFLPDGQRHSFARQSHWFLRGAPYIPDSALSRRIPRDFFVELQHFDLAAEVVPELPHLEAFDPLLLLWDSHDLDKIKTHGVLFETRAAQGRLLVSAANHAGTNNSAGRWLLGVLLDHLRSDAPPHATLPSDVWAYVKARLHAEQTNLVSLTWRFKPDPKGEGLTQHWHLPSLASDADWKDIRIGNWWELQGYADLDGWAWYRLWVEIPAAWAGRDCYLSFEGVDDMYQLYVNGMLAGKGGDLATRQDALNEKKSHNISHLVMPGQKALIAVRVYDWYGYGGIFRPVTLGTLPLNPALDLLK